MIEVVSGRLGGEPAEELLAFWAERDAVPETDARARLNEVVCVVRRDGALAGVSSVRATDLALVGGRRFLIYTGVLSESATEGPQEVFRATFDALDSEFYAAPAAPIGLGLLVTPEARRALPPEAEWSGPCTIYAGYLEDGRQVRIAYFTDASITPDARPLPEPDWRLEREYRLEVFTEQDALSEADLVAMWLREGVLSYSEAKRRVAEVLHVATGAEGRPVAVSTAYLKRHDQLRADLWHYRLFVTSAHRQSNLASALSVGGYEHLAARFVSGEDRRGIGTLYEIENAFLKNSFPMAVWPRLGCIFIGENARGNHVRVRYFPGAPAPEFEPQPQSMA